MEKILILSVLVALYVQAVWYVLQPGEIFESVSAWLERRLNSKLWAPVFDCPVCMTPYHGLVFLLFVNIGVIETGRPASWPVILLCATGIQVVINKFQTYPPDDRQGT